MARSARLAKRDTAALLCAGGWGLGEALREDGTSASGGVSPREAEGLEPRVDGACELLIGPLLLRSERAARVAAPAATTTSLNVRPEAGLLLLLLMGSDLV